MKRITIEVKDEHEVEIISQVLHEAVEVDPALDFPYTFEVEDFRHESRGTLADSQDAREFYEKDDEGGDS